MSTDFAPTVELRQVACPADLRELLSPHEDTPEFNIVLAKRTKRGTQGWRALTGEEPEQPAVEEPVITEEPEPVAEEPEPAPARE